MLYVSFQLGLQRLRSPTDHAKLAGKVAQCKTKLFQPDFPHPAPQCPDPMSVSFLLTVSTGSFQHLLPGTALQAQGGYIQCRSGYPLLLDVCKHSSLDTINEVVAVGMCTINSCAFKRRTSLLVELLAQRKIDILIHLILPPVIHPWSNWGFPSFIHGEG